MGKFDELRNTWIDALKTLKSISTQALYFLLEPDNDSKFFESVDLFKDCIEEPQFVEFQMLAIEYLLEYKKQNKLGIKTEPYKPNTGTWPFGPLDNDQIQKCTKPNTIPGLPFGPVTAYSPQPNITRAQDDTRSASIAPGKPACRCFGCEFFDGCDICYHHENFGPITQQSLDKCKKYNLLREKLYGTT